MRQAGVGLFCLLLLPGLAIAGSDPAYEWQTLSTEHFRIHFYQGGEDVARHVGAIAEEAYTRCKEVFGLEPSEVVEIVIRDDVDTANAFTWVYPYDKLIILPYPPEPESELANYDDPMRTLVYHEYGHIIQMDQYSGLPGAINSVLGKTIVPNGAVPAWFSEGFATYVESRLTGKGRVRSSLFDMYLRAAVLGKGLLDISELTEAPLRLPRGSAPYLYGSYLFAFIAVEYGEKAITRFIQDYGRRLIPFALNHLARRHFGHDFKEIYTRFLRREEERARATVERIKKEGVKEGELLTSDGEFNTYPVFGKDPEVVYFVRSDGRSRSRIFSLDLETRKLSPIGDCFGGCGHLYWDSDGLLTTHLEPYRFYSYFGDVFRLDLSTGKEERLTEARRARDPARLPDGRLIFVSSKFNQVALVAYNEESSETEYLIPYGEFAGLSDPRPVPGKDLIVFSGSKGGQWDLWALDMKNKTLEALTEDEALDRDPFPGPDGSFVLFASDHGGVYDIFAVELPSKRLYRVTRVLGGAFWPTLSPDGRWLVYASYSDRGYDLAIMPFDRDVLEALEEGPQERKARPFTIEQSKGPTTSYSPWPSLRPRSLKPKFVATTSGLSLLGAEVSGADAVGLHSFYLLFESDMASFSPTTAFSYAFEGLFPTLALTASTFPFETKTFSDDRFAKVNSRAYSLSLSASLPIPKRKRRFSVGASYSLLWFKGVSARRPTDPASLEPKDYKGFRSASLSFFANFSSLEAYPWSISPERGVSAGLSGTITDKRLGSEGDAFTLEGYAQTFLPLGSSHVLALFASSGWSRGEEGFEGLFTLGGPPRQDIISAIVNQKLIDWRGLRGFPRGLLRGNTFVLGNLEYRFPILYVHQGLETLPLVARRLFGAVFADYGGAFSGPFDKEAFRLDLGAEVALATSLFLDLALTFRVGYAHGFGPQGLDVVYFLLAP